MIDFLNMALPILLYVCGIIVLIILMVLGIKLIKVLDKVDRIADNVESKVNSLNLAFSLIDKTTDSIVSMGNNVVGAVNGIASKVFNRKKSKKEEEEIL